MDKICKFLLIIFSITNGKLNIIVLIVFMIKLYIFKL